MTKIKEVEMENGCIECISHNPNKNGKIYIYEKGKCESYSKIKYVLEKGEIPKGMVVYNTCGNINCGNPEHMEIITRNEFTRINILASRDVDSYIKANNMTSDDIAAIYTAPSSIHNKELAEKYHCSDAKISNIRRGKSFVEITENLESPLHKKDKKHHLRGKFASSLTPEQIQEIKNTDSPHGFFKYKYGVSQTVVRSIRMSNSS